MTAEKIFEIAIKLPTPQERAAYVRGACGDDQTLRQQVESLIQAHEEVGGFMPTDPGESGITIPDRPLTEEAGTRLGRYKLLQKIGEGGMGVVYMAEQTEPVVRKVALKIIKLGMDTKSVIARFEAERQALAMMDHPNIARVLDAGATDTGRPYFVMELIKGVSINQYCDKNHLATKDRLQLFIAVCKAVHYAHQKGVIHRDIKPSNILVTLHDGKPVPKVIDFGVAKATNQRLTEKTLFTNFAQMIGTPAYMSPEQAEMSGLDLDTRTDVYSLGVLLYELLTGTTPFPEKELLSAGYGEMQRIIAEQEPERPSLRVSTLLSEQQTVVSKNRSTELLTLQRQIKGDLDWIAMKALEKDRTRRYDTPEGLAADVEKHLKYEPVSAARPSASYRFRKLARRRRGPFIAALCGLALVVTGTAISTWQARRAASAEDAAREAAALARAARESEAQWREQAESSATRSRIETLLAGKGEESPANGLLSPDGTKVVYTEWSLTGGPVVLQNVATGDKTVLKKGPLIPTGYEFGMALSGTAAWSPDSKAVCLPWWRNSDSELIILQESGKPRVLKPSVSNVAYFPMDWSLDGRLILCSVQTNKADRLVLISESNGGVRELGRAGHHARFSPDGRHLVYEGVKTNKGDLFVFDLERNIEHQVTRHPEEDNAPVWSVDGKYVVFSSHRRDSWDLWAVKVEEGVAKGGPFLLRSAMERSSKTRQPNGDLVLQSTLSILDPGYVDVPTDSNERIGPPKRFSKLGYGRHLFMGWSPDGKRIAYLKNFFDRDGQEVRVVSLAEGSERAYPTSFFAREALWHPDGERIALVRRAVVLLDLQNGETRTAVTNVTAIFTNFVADDVLKRPDGSVNMVSFGPTGWLPQSAELLFRLGTPLSIYRSPLGTEYKPPRHVSIDLASVRGRLLTGADAFGDCEFYKVSPDAARVACVLEKGQVLIDAKVDHTDVRELMRLAAESKRWIGEPEWSPDGTMIAFPVVPERGIQELHVVNVRDGKDRQVDLEGRELSEYNILIFWSPDSRKIGFTQSEAITEIALLKNVGTIITERATQAGPPEM